MVSLRDSYSECNAAAYSRNIFVHNNSKHGRKNRRVNRRSQTPEERIVGQFLEKPLPVITALSSNEGSTRGGDQVVIIGENFFPGLQANFGGVNVSTHHITNNAIKCITPNRDEAGPVDITLQFKGDIMASGGPHNRFYFTGGWLKPAPNSVSPVNLGSDDSSVTSMDYGFERLSRLVPRAAGDPIKLSKATVLRRAADLAEAVFAQGSNNARSAYHALTYSQSHQQAMGGAHYAEGEYARGLPNNASPPAYVDPAQHNPVTTAEETGQPNAQTTYTAQLSNMMTQGASHTGLFQSSSSKFSLHFCFA